MELEGHGFFEQVGSAVEFEVELEGHSFFEQVGSAVEFEVELEGAWLLRTGWLIFLHQETLHDEKQLQLSQSQVSSTS